MPDWIPRFPFLPGFPGNDEGPRYPGIGPLIDQLLEERRKRQAAEQQEEPEEPPPNPQIGVEELPPVNTPLPAPLPNPRGEGAGVFTPLPGRDFAPPESREDNSPKFHGRPTKVWPRGAPTEV